MEATPVRNVLLYYPIYDLQREYIPAAEKINPGTQSEFSKKVEISFNELGSNLLKAQTQFVLVDYLTLGEASVSGNKTIQIGQNHYSSIVFPEGVVFPSSVSRLIEQAKNKGVRIVFADNFNETPSPEKLSELSGNENKLVPADTAIAFGRFIREGRTIYMIVNTGNENYLGELETIYGRQYVELEPKTGTILNQQRISEKKIALYLAPLQTKIIVVF
jgi:hypothetical protein